MDVRLFLKERDDFSREMYGLSLGNIDLLRTRMKKSIEKFGLGKPFLIPPAGLTHAILQKAFREKIGVDYVFSESLDNVLSVVHDRWPLQSYFIRHGGHREAIAGDKELRLFSSRRIWDQKIVTMTSLEISQFSFEHAFFSGAFIDVESVSLASGSRDSDGGVPHVNLHGGRVVVFWYRAPSAYSRLRARSVKDSCFPL